MLITPTHSLLIDIKLSGGNGSLASMSSVNDIYIYTNVAGNGNLMYLQPSSRLLLSDLVVDT